MEAYIKPREVEVQEIEYPKLALGDRKCKRRYFKIVSTNICGSDQHMVRAALPRRQVLYQATKSLVLGSDVGLSK